MSVRLEFLIEARAEFISAIDFYETSTAGLGTRFVYSVDAALLDVRRRPDSFAVMFADVRRAAVDGFPYGIYYRIESDHLLVIGIFHGSRDPTILRRRID